MVAHAALDSATTHTPICPYCTSREPPTKEMEHPPPIMASDKVRLLSPQVKTGSRADINRKRYHQDLHADEAAMLASLPKTN